MYTHVRTHTYTHIDTHLHTHACTHAQKGGDYERIHLLWPDLSGWRLAEIIGDEPNIVSQNMNATLSSKYCLFYCNCVCLIFVYACTCMHGFVNVVCTLFVHLWRSEDNLGCCCSPSTTRSLVQLFVRHDGSWNSRMCPITVQEYWDYRHVLLCLGLCGLWGFKHRS